MNSQLVFSSGVVSLIKELLLPLATFSLSVAVGIVAFQQWRVARNKLRLDLCEKRFEVYSATKDFLMLFLVDPQRANDRARARQETFFTEAAYGRFVMATSGAEFLFGNDVSQYLARIRKHVAFLHRDLWYLERAKSKEDRTSDANGQNAKSIYRLDTISGKTWRMTSKPIVSPPDAQHDKPSMLTWANGWEEMSEIEAALVKAKAEYLDAVESQKGVAKA
jgi:hypothetical protein